MTEPWLRGLRCLSPSSLNLWREDRAAWAVRYVLGVSDYSTSPAAHRGTAVEAGIVHGGLHPDAAPDECARMAVTCLVQALGRRDEALEDLSRASTTHGVPALRTMGAGPAVAAQVLVKQDVPGLPLPILGYIDLLCARASVDVKSSVRCWRGTADEDELLQMAVYASLTERPAKLLYVGRDGACVVDGAEPFGSSWRTALELAEEVGEFLRSCGSATAEEVVAQAGSPCSDDSWTWHDAAVEAWERACGRPFPDFEADSRLVIG